jgi:uncharacterized protein (DUF488 family)
MPKKTTTVATIGYEGAAMPGFLAALREAGVGLLVDVRAVASSRRPGFSKTRLAANLAESGIDYLHLRSLGTPADGRAAARAGRHEEMHRIFRAHLATDEARDGMETLADLAGGARKLCLLCFEADPAHCHRTLVAAALAERMPLRVEHLRPHDVDPATEERD